MVALETALASVADRWMFTPNVMNAQIEKYANQIWKEPKKH
jgi:hypothetical protein